MSSVRRCTLAMSIVIFAFATACGGDDPVAGPTPGVTDPTSTTTTTPVTTPDTTPGRTGRTVDVIDNAYVPPELTVSVGTEVIWTYAGPDAPHSVTATDRSFDSHPDCSESRLDACMQTAGETFRFTFTTAGRSTYSCKIHGELMSGTIIIE
ncbi:MAG: plastocyanin/azurin family copper-binding protein [Actinomycetota bacterium]